MTTNGIDVTERKTKKAGGFINKGNAIAILDSIVRKSDHYLWSRTLDDVISDLAAIPGEIVLFDECVKVLRTAETTKMRGDANRHLIHVKQLWREARL